MTSLNGVQKTVLSSTNSGVASNLVRFIKSAGRLSRSPVRNCQAGTRLVTLSGVICASGENLVHPLSPPQWSHPYAGAAIREAAAQTPKIPFIEPKNGCVEPAPELRSHCGMNVTASMARPIIEEHPQRRYFYVGH